MPSGALVNPFLDLQLKLTHLCFLFFVFLPAVFWGDIALDEEDLKLFHIDKTQDWIKQSVEKTGHRTGKYCVVALPCPAPEGGVRDSPGVDVDHKSSVFDLSGQRPLVCGEPEAVELEPPSVLILLRKSHLPVQT